MTKTKKLPKPCVMWANFTTAYPFDNLRYDKFYSGPVAVIPCRTQKEARAVVKLCGRQTALYDKAREVVYEYRQRFGARDKHNFIGPIDPVITELENELENTP